MGQDPSGIRAEIAETRARVGDEVDALSYKTDVPARVGDYVDEKKQAVTGRMSSMKDTVLPSGEKVSRMKDTAERNPLGLAAGSLALGFVAGMLLPSTRIENEKMGEVSDRVVDAVKETASDAVESGKQVAQDAADSAMHQGQDLASNLQDRAQESVTTAQPGM